ncbi:unnamed protein product [Amaranthus hypochondriacus]
MEQNAQVAKKLWHIVRVAFFMLRKNMSKRKLLLDLKYLTMKRPKLAGRSSAGKLTHHHHYYGGGAYEFSCSNTPNHPNYIFPFQFNHKKKSPKPTPIYEEIDENEVQTINKMLETMLSTRNYQNDDVEGSPIPYFLSPLPGFGVGQGPIVRVTDSPYSLHGNEVGNNKVDEDAEDFIQRFHDQLRQQRMVDVI